MSFGPMTVEQLEARDAHQAACAEYAKQLVGKDLAEIVATVARDAAERRGPYAHLRNHAIALLERASSNLIDAERTPARPLPSIDEYVRRLAFRASLDGHGYRSGWATLYRIAEDIDRPATPGIPDTRYEH